MLSSNKDNFISSFPFSMHFLTSFYSLSFRLSTLAKISVQCWIRGKSGYTLSCSWSSKKNISRDLWDGHQHTYFSLLHSGLWCPRLPSPHRTLAMGSRLVSLPPLHLSSSHSQFSFPCYPFKTQVKHGPKGSSSLYSSMLWQGLDSPSPGGMCLLFLHGLEHWWVLFLLS